MKYSIKPIAVRPEWVEELGDIESVIFYQQILYWGDKGGRDDGYIYKTAKDIEYETTLTERQQRRVREKLKKMGYIDIIKKKANGAPTLHFKIAKWIMTKGTNGNVQKVQMETDKRYKSITESTTESTSEKITLQPDGCEVFSSDEYINTLSNSPKKHIQLIGWYFREKNLVFPNKKSAQAELLRWVRDASLLIEYPEKKIIETKNLVQEKFPFDWKLSTIVKYINETKSDEKILLECIEEAQAVMGLDGDWDVRARRNYLEKKGIPFENHWVNPEWTKWLKKYPYLKTT